MAHRYYGLKIAQRTQTQDTREIVEALPRFEQEEDLRPGVLDDETGLGLAIARVEPGHDHAQLLQGVEHRHQLGGVGQVYTGSVAFDQTEAVKPAANRVLSSSSSA